MLIVALIFAALAALIHLYIFWLEAIAFEGPGRVVFALSREDAAIMKPVFYNQGFYNLFLAIGTTIGVGIMHASHAAGGALITFGCGSMVLAALVLVTSDATKRRAALVQGLCPAVALAFLALSGLS
jgi:putative membrane protein